MATIKSYTDIEQSHKLAEILPLESADMHYSRQIDFDYFPPDVESFYPTPFYKDEKEDFNYDIPCWSLAALLDILPNENMLVKTTSCEYYCLAKDVMTKHYDNPIDAAYEMILKLSELNLL